MRSRRIPTPKFLTEWERRDYEQRVIGLAPLPVSTNRWSITKDMTAKEAVADIFDAALDVDEFLEQLEKRGYVIVEEKTNKQIMHQQVTLWRHKKRGFVYEILHDNVTMQCSIVSLDAPMQCSIVSLDNAPVVVYRNVETLSVWVRPAGEFYDGRFERV